MKKPKFSIIICTYNMGDCISNAINSILGQDFTDYEMIIYNDCSTDDTKEVLGKVKDERVKIINGRKNVGLGKARNNAVNEANGEYILYLDADDTLYENTTLNKINKVIGRKNPDVCYFGVNYINGSNKQYIPTAENSTKEARILCDMHFAVASKCWKREFLKENNIEFVEDIYYEDMVYSIKATILAKTIDYGEFPIYNYVRNRDGSITTAPNLKRCVDMYKSLSYILELYDITPEEYKPYLLSFVKQEAMSIPYKTGKILKAYKQNINCPMFEKRKYTFDENDEEVCI